MIGISRPHPRTKRHSVASVDAVEVIRTKRDGRALSDEQICWFIDAYTHGIVADEQAAALAMAIFWRGLDGREVATLTQSMLDSGVRLDLSATTRPTVDKHSTGGVGDKVSLVLVPLMMACGAAVPQLSGRGLGHTGGTLDKMESIPGWRAELENAEMVRLLDLVGGFIAAASHDVAPADRKLYGLRDVTGTVESIPLIASSIMSKKIAEGTAALVRDVKFGAGGTVGGPDRGRELAEMMVELGEAHGVRTVALQTSMENVLGRAAGNAVEVLEAIECLAGGGPDDLRVVTLALAREMCALAEIDVDPAAVLDGGTGMDAWRALVKAQGGDPIEPLPVAHEIETIVAERSGVMRRLDVRAAGVAAWRLGAGRARKEDPVSAVAGVVCRVKPGESVEAGAPVLELHIDDPRRLDSALDALDGAIEIGDEPAATRPLVLDRIAAS